MAFVVIFLCLVGEVLSDVLSLTDYTLKFSDSGSGDCLNGKTLVASEDSESVIVCSTISTDQLEVICSKVDTCTGSTGVITSYSGVSPIPLVIEGDSLTFYSETDCQVNVLCYDPASQCYLPQLENGQYKATEGTVYTSELLENGAKVNVDCHTNYTWTSADTVTCIKMSSGSCRLSSTPQCVPLSEDDLMTITVDVTTEAHISSLTGVEEKYLDATQADSFLSKEDLLNQTCGTSEPCFIPNYMFDQSSTTSEEDGADNLALLLGEHTSCFESSVLSLFLLGLQLVENKEIFAEFDTRPLKVKRGIVDNSLQVRINKLDLVYEPKETRNTGVKVAFYLFQYGAVLSPSVVTKVLAQVPREKYDIILESYCRLKKCGDKAYNECTDIPTMLFNSFPKPSLPCNYQGSALHYGDPVQTVCSANEYNNETELTLCLYGNKYNPARLPGCNACGGSFSGTSFNGPSRTNGRNSRGANCVWAVSTQVDNVGMFYQDSRVDKSECKNPVSYLKVTEFDVNGQVVGKKQDVCFGVIMNLSPRFKIEFTSNADSDNEDRFTFQFEESSSPLPWYRRYLAILVAAPIIVGFFLALVFLGVYCDHRKKRRTKELVSPVILLEHGDLTSNGTWKRNEGFQTSTKIADNEAALSPQPRVHNAVPKIAEKKKKKDRTSLIKDDSADDSAFSSPGYGSWVINNPGNSDNSSHKRNNNISEADGSSQVHRSPNIREAKSNTTLPVPDSSLTSQSPLAASTPLASTNQTDVVATRPRRKKRRKKKSKPVAEQRPLPDLNGTALQPRNLPPLENDIDNNLSARALPPITNQDPVEDRPYVSNLDVD